MSCLVSCEAAARLDAWTVRAAALPPLLLMEDASLRLWQALEPLAAAAGAGRQRDLAAAVGSGNNAGDALALLRHARFAGLERLTAVLGSERMGESALVQLASLRALGVRVLSWERERAEAVDRLASAGLVVDGIAGTGLRGPLREPLASLAGAISDCGAPVASIDLPSGLSDRFEAGWPLVRAAWTLSIEPAKAALYYPSARPAAGIVMPVRGVFPATAPREETATLLDPAALSDLIPAVRPECYKGSRGRVAVFAGSVGATGAASLAARAALAAGSGYVALYAAPGVLGILAASLESVMVKPEPEEPGQIDPGRWDAFVAGPGWGLGERNRAALARLLESGLPGVLDADALRLFKDLRDRGLRPRGPLVLTPHPGEYAALMGSGAERALADPAGELPGVARELGAVLVLKAHVTWIASPDGRLAVWDGMEPGLGTAGSGDVLAGLAGGLLPRCLGSVPAPRGPDGAFDAARAAVIAHGIAGRGARERLGWFEAGSLIGEAARILGAPPPADRAGA